jgi:hypothetical protein
LPTQGKKQETGNLGQRSSTDLGFVIDPLYGKLDILQIGDAGDDQHSFLVTGKDFRPDWREESELLSVHLTEAGRKKVEQIG